MEVRKTEIDGLFILQPRIWADNRGYFYETYQTKAFHQLGIVDEFLQDNESCSAKGVLRGLHFQKPPYAQGKLVHVVVGKVLDVAVDIRKNSPTFGKHITVELSAENKTMFWIPAGFAHGFVALEDNTVFSYKCTNIYNKESEECLVWNDPALNIDWGIKDPKVSEKDAIGTSLQLLNSPF